MANSKVACSFSLWSDHCERGFDLRVFPYDDQVFDLPKGSEWIRTPLHKWLTEKRPTRCAASTMLTTSNPGRNERMLSRRLRHFANP